MFWKKRKQKQQLQKDIQQLEKYIQKDTKTIEKERKQIEQAINTLLDIMTIQENKKTLTPQDIKEKPTEELIKILEKALEKLKEIA